MSTHTSNSSRQNHHHEPPPLPPPLAVASPSSLSAGPTTGGSARMAAISSSTTTNHSTSSTTSDEEQQQQQQQQQQQLGEDKDDQDNHEHRHHHRTETGVPLNDAPASPAAAAAATTTTPSASPACVASSPSVRRSSLPTDSSNYSGYSSSSNKSGLHGSTTKNKGGGRSLELRKLPIDTTLFRGKLKGRRRQKSQQQPQQATSNTCTCSAPLTTTTPILLNTFSSRVSNASSIPSVLEDSDSTLVDDGTMMMLMDDHDDHGRVLVRQGAGNGATAGANSSSRGISAATTAATTRKSNKDNKNHTTQPPQSSSPDDAMATTIIPKQESLAARCLRSTCLRSDFSLQTQLLLSFGMVSTITIVLVMVICVAVSILSGQKVNQLTQESLEELSFRMEGKMARYVGEALSNRLLPDDIVRILHDAIVDRLVGYPNYPGFENDTLTPFTNIHNQQRIYPVKGPSARLDWDLHDVVTPTTAREHVQHRYDLYSGYENVTTSHAAYTFQGTCNPQATTPDRFDWYKNCTDANNDITTGGIVQPVSTNQHLFERMSDLTPLLKALYEASPSMRDIGICFANAGAGSCFTFPGYTMDGRSHYVSEGCDWMKEPNPYKPSQPIGTPKMIARCHPKGKVVYNREYNPLERSWCIDIALHPFSINIFGPFQDVRYPNQQLMLVGQAIYDPLTLEFIGCMFQDYTIADVVAALEEAKITTQSHVSVTRWDPQGTIGASTAWNWTERSNIPLIHELNVGINTPDDFQKFYDMVDYTKPWDPQQVRDIYAQSLHHNVEHGYFVAVYPMPQIPDEYDPHYRPQWLVVMSVSSEDMLGEVDSLQENVDDSVLKLVYGSFVAGCVGWGVVMALIIVVSRALTLPLTSMNQTTNAIVNNFGGSSEKGICYNAPSTNWLLDKCTPETEVSLVVTEFEKMVHKFSGSSKMAKAVQVRFTELGNHFCFEREFEGLYNSRHQDGSFPYSYDDGSNGTAIGCDGRKNPKYQQKNNHLHLKNFGSILTGCQSHFSIRRPDSKIQSFRQPSSLQGKRLSSPLFIWIVLFIVAPLLISSVAISAIVTFKVSKQLTEAVADGKDMFVDLEKFSLKSTVRLRANWIGGKVEQRTRELHVLNRYASWLLFGGLDRRDTFTKITSGSEKCKSESNPIDCDYLQEKYAMCLESYAKHDDYSFRHGQDLFFVCESHDTMPDGDRNWSLSFPDVSYSPATTSWWDNVTAVPGSEKGSDAAGYDTTYDRLRVLSAIPVFQTIQNSASDKDIILMNAVAMEADGMVVGYQGCSLAGEAIAAFWESTISNHAYEIRPELCPNGKYGYDPRCRMFYNTGKELAESGKAELLVTSPYRFATDNIMTQTCTSPLRDPITNTYVGQVYVDFQTDSILDILSANNTPLPAGGFPLLMAAHPEIEGLDAIIGPGFTLKEGSLKSIEEVVLRNEINCIDAGCERNKEEFGAILERIRNSTDVETGNFVIRLDDGTDEQIFIAYAPVVVQTSHAENSSDFKRGVYLANNVIFFVALTETEASFVSAFEQVEDDMELTVDIGIAILSITIVLATLVVIYISYVLTISITQPMLYFLELIQDINEQDDNEIQADFGTRSGSREVKSVANAMGTLHKIVKCANSAYFAGDIDKAYAVLSDSARLFKRLDNKKAVGVANNNLGNTMLAMYRMMKLTAVERYCGMTRREVVLKGMTYFHIAIQLGEKAYEEFHEAEGWSPSCLDFMQHLANRYFNRAMFLLTVKGDHDNPKELEDLGFRDLQIARDMDVEIVDQGTEVGWKVNTMEKLFNVSLNRVRGHLLLLEMGYPDDWDLEELLEELFRSLKKELKSNQQTSALFRELRPAGRMQQVETELMRYKVLKGDLDTASKIAVRMLMEDEFILPEAQIKAVQVLLRSIENDESRKHLKGQLKQYESWLRNAKVKCDTSTVPDEAAPGEDVTEVIMMSIAKLDDLTNNDDESSYEDLQETKKTSLLATTRGDVTMEIF